MIQSNELRIGNWVKDEEGIFPITATFFNLLKLNLETTYPIMLTEEWLLKLGFEKLTGWDNMEYFDNEGIHIYLCGDMKKEWFEYDNDMEIKSVHQIQNLFFALKEKELIIK